jgi:hypothetical protein
MSGRLEDAMADVVAQITARGRITADDVLALRRLAYGGPDIAMEMAEHVIALDHLEGDKAPEWRAFYVEMLTDFLVEQEEPSGYVDDVKADWLIARIVHDGHIKTATELDLLVTILEKATKSPARLERFALEAVRDTVIAGSGPARAGGRHVPGVVDAADVALLRRILYAVGGDGHVGISRNEAEVLFEINDATTGADNDPDWPDLFVKAIANNVLFVSGYRVPARSEALRREAWLEERGSVGDFFKRMVTGVADVLTGYGVPEPVTEDDALHGHDPDFASAERVDDEEARWLAKRLAHDGELDENERILLAALHDMTGEIHPILKTIIENAN